MSTSVEELSGSAPPVESQGRTAGRQRHVPGEAGAWIFILGDMGVFAVFFAVYLAARAEDVPLFRESQEHLDRNAGALNTVLLLVSSLLVVMAVRAMRTASARHFAPGLVLGALGCGVGFVAVKAFEYGAKIADGITPATNDFYMYYFILTGLHLMHLLIGLVVLVILWRLSKKPQVSTSEWSFFEGGACFWHMVDLLWIVLFPLLFLVR